MWPFSYFQERRDRKRAAAAEFRRVTIARHYLTEAEWDHYASMDFANSLDVPYPQNEIEMDRLEQVAFTRYVQANLDLLKK